MKLTVRFYMTGGHVIVVRDVKKVEMTRDSSTGNYSAYHLEWADDAKDAPNLFTLSVPDIIAVIATEE